MKLYKNGQWSDLIESEFGLEKFDNEKMGFQDYKDANHFNQRATYHTGESCGWELLVYRHGEKEIYLATADFNDDNWVEFVIYDAFSFMLFCKEYQEFFKDKVDEWVDTEDGRWIRTSEILWVGHKEVKSRWGDGPSYQFFCQTKQGEEVDLTTVESRGYYMRSNFGIHHYRDHTKETDREITFPKEEEDGDGNNSED